MKNKLAFVLLVVLLVALMAPAAWQQKPGTAQDQQKDQQAQKAEAQKQEQAKVANLNNMLAQAATLQQAGQFDQAIQVLTQATQIDPNQYVLWGRLADAQRLSAGKATDAADKKQRYLAAIESYKKAIALKPSVGAFYNNMGEAYAKTGDATGAAEAYQKAALNDPPNAALYYFNLGAVLTNAGKPDEANAAFDKAITADPKVADAYYQKAVNLLAKATLDPKTNKMVYSPEVPVDLNKYLELRPDGAYAQNAKDLLSGLGETIETSYGTKKKPAVKK